MDLQQYLLKELLGKNFPANRQEFNDFIDRETIKYQKKYGFEIDHTAKGMGTHNNESDAFKHAFMQTWLSIYTGDWKS